MLEKNEIARRLYEYLLERVKGKKVEEVRIGVGYVAVALDDILLLSHGSSSLVKFFG